MNDEDRTERLVQSLVTHLRGRSRTLGEAEYETVEFCRRRLRKIAYEWRRAQRDEAGVSGEAVNDDVLTKNRAARELFGDVEGWVAGYEGTQFHAKHYDDGYMVIVLADDLQALVGAVGRYALQVPA